MKSVEVWVSKPLVDNLAKGVHYAQIADPSVDKGYDMTPAYVKGTFIPDDETGKMKRGKTEVETLRLNGWGVGDILEGDEGRGPDRIIITAIGSQRFLCKWQHGARGVLRDDAGSTTLTCREWKKVGNVFDLYGDLSDVITQ